MGLYLPKRIFWQKVKFNAILISRIISLWKFRKNTQILCTKVYKNHHLKILDVDKKKDFECIKHSGILHHFERLETFFHSIFMKDSFWKTSELWNWIVNKKHTLGETVSSWNFAFWRRKKKETKWRNIKQPCKKCCKRKTITKFSNKFIDHKTLLHVADYLRHVLVLNATAESLVYCLILTNGTRGRFHK